MFFLRLVLSTLISIFLLLEPGLVEAEDLPRNQPELVLCSQNLNNFGQTSNLGYTQFKKKRKKKSLKKQLSHLVQRFEESACDIIALQEVTGGSSKIALGRLKKITSKMRKETGRNFIAMVGESRDRRIRNGFLVASERVRLVNSFNFTQRPLPKFDPLSPLSYFSRGPFAILLEVNRPGIKPQQFIILSIHLKSKSSSYRDPSKTQFELRRMQMAEAIRRIAQEELAEKFPKAVIIVMGDLNSDSEDAASEIISGELLLKDFSPNNCRLNSDLEAECQEQPQRHAFFTRLFDYQLERGGIKGGKGSYRYQGKHQLIDEILISSKNRALAFSSQGLANIGFAGRLHRGSDHHLLWLRLNWE